MKIGELAEKSGLSTKTLRYYEAVGLLVPERNQSGWRTYDSSAFVVLQLLSVGKRLGLSLSEIGELVGLFRDPSFSNEDLVERIQPHKLRLRNEIRALEQAELLLETLTTDCPFRRC